MRKWQIINIPDLFYTAYSKKRRKSYLHDNTTEELCGRRTFKIYVPEYRNAMLQVAKDFKCNYIDLSRLSTDYFNFRGKNYVNTLYMKLNLGQYPAWEQGINEIRIFKGMVREF